MSKSKKRKNKKETSKKLAIAILVVALIDIQLTYILAFMGMEIAETLSVAIVTEIISVFSVYSIKAYLGKKAEEDMRYKEENNGPY